MAESRCHPSPAILPFEQGYLLAHHLRRESLSDSCRLRFLEVSTGTKNSRRKQFSCNRGHVPRGLKNEKPGIACDPGLLRKSGKKSVFRGREPIFESLYAGAQRVIFIPGLNGHLANRVVFLAAHDIQTVQPAIRLRSETPLPLPCAHPARHLPHRSSAWRIHPENDWCLSCYWRLSFVGSGHRIARC